MFGSLTRTSPIAFTRAEDGLVKGYVSTWEAPEEHDRHGTIFAQGCFDKDVEARGPKGSNEIPSLWEHRQPFGMPALLESDSKGQRMHVEPTETMENVDRQKYIAHGVVRGMSVGFNPIVWEVLEKHTTPWGAPVVRFTECELREGSITSRPSNHNALIDKARKAGVPWRRSESGLWTPVFPGEARDDLSVHSRDVLEALLDAIDAGEVEHSRAFQQIAAQTGIDVSRFENIRAGRVLSKRNQDLLRNAVEAIENVLLNASKEEEKSAPAADDSELAGLLNTLGATIGLLIQPGDA